MIELSLGASEVFANESQKLDVYVTNLSNTTISNIRCTLKFPPQLPLLKGRNIIAISKLNPNQRGKHTVVVLPKAVGNWQISSRSSTYRDASGSGRQIKSASMNISVVNKPAQPLQQEAKLSLECLENEFPINEWSHLNILARNDSSIQIQRIELRIEGQVKSQSSQHLNSLPPGKKIKISLPIFPLDAGGNVPISIKSTYIDVLGRAQKTNFSSYLKVFSKKEKMQGDTFHFNNSPVNFSKEGNINVDKQNFDMRTSNSLPKAAAEIQELLQQLSKSYPSESSSEQLLLAGVAISEIEKNPNLKARIISALKASGIEAFKEAVNHPTINILMAAIEGWKET